MPERAQPVRLAFDVEDMEILLRASESIAARDAGLRIVLEGGDDSQHAFLAKRLAKARGLRLKRVDLAELVSKGIGETEKALKRLFARADSAQSILFFDEADALFGRRSAVKDSHDRYANLETSYLTALERFRGLAILTTNLRAARYPGLQAVADMLVDCHGPGAAERGGASDPSLVAWDAPLSNRHFLVLIGDLEIGFCSVDGIGDAFERREEEEAEVRGFETLVLRRALSRSKDLYHWRRAIRDGKKDRRTVELWQLAAPLSKPVNRWRFLDCWPCRWSGPSFDAIAGELAFEEIELCYERVEWL